MKVLVYGGCHAQVIGHFLSLNPVLEVQCIVNWKLIAEQKPFPLTPAAISKFDKVVYSPVLNHPGYNTEELFQSFPRSRRFIYPWLQWNGYFPFVTKSKTSAGLQSWWMDQRLLDLRKSCSSLSRFKELACSDGWVSTQVVLEGVELATKRLIANEVGCDFMLSPIVNGFYRSTRLFLTPDHPSSLIYRLLLIAISDFIGVHLIEAQASILQDSSEYIFQDDAFLPIMPYVATSLDLSFGLENLFYNRLINSCSLDFDDFLMMHFDFDQLSCGRHALRMRV